MKRTSPFLSAFAKKKHLRVEVFSVLKSTAYLHLQLINSRQSEQRNFYLDLKPWLLEHRQYSLHH